MIAMGNLLLLHQVARLHRSQVHVETHPGDRLRLSFLARTAAFSPLPYHRLFKRLTGETVGAHLRRLCLERAAFDIVSSRRSVRDIGLGQGFDSPEASSRAFGRRFGDSTLSRFWLGKTTA
jgi:AraC family transcriptional regulator